MTIPKEFKFIFSRIKNRKRIYFGAVSALVSAVALSFIPYIYGHLVDVAIAPHSQLKIILGFISLWLFLSLLNEFLSRYSQRQSYEIAIEVTNDLMVDIFHHLINLPLKFHKARKMGKIMRRIDRGIDNDLFNLIDDTLFSFLPSLLSFFVAFVILLVVEWRLSLILVATSIGYVLVTLVYSKYIIETQKLLHRGWEKSYGVLWDSVLNVQTVKSSTAEEFERKRNVKNFNWAGGIYEKWRFVWLKMNAWQRIIFTLSFIAVLSVGILMLRAGQLSAGKLIMFVGYTSLLTAPLSQLANQYRMAKSGMYSFKRAMSYYNIPPEKNAPHAIEMEIKGKVVFKDADFAYKKSQMILKNISFEVLPGQTVALVGESGVGKTTLVDLIGRYITPTKGQILIDGVDIGKIDLLALRRQMALVPQEVLLFNDTIKNNIRYGNLESTDKQIAEAAKAANAHEFIEKFPRKYDQVVGERGIKLSTGQKQRIAIARAILRNPKILILDEATSALDSVSEKLVQEALMRLIKGRTTFVIAHRLSTIQHSDKIIVLEKGEVLEMGTHEELMRLEDGIYRHFWELQSASAKMPS